MKKIDPLFNVSDEETLGGFTTRDFVRLLFKHKYIIVITFLVITSLVTFALNFLPATYVTSGKILISNGLQVEPAFYTETTSYPESSYTSMPRRSLEAEKEMLTSRPLAAQVVRELELDFSTVYHPAYKLLLDAIANFVDDALVALNIKDKAPPPSFDDTVNAFVDSIRVESALSGNTEPNSTVITVTMLGADPALEQKALNRLMELYAGFQPGLNKSRTRQERDIVVRKLQSIRHDMLQAQQKYQQFLSHQNGIVKDEAVAFKPFYRAEIIDPGMSAGTADKTGGFSVLTTASDITAVSIMKTRLVQMELRLLDMETYRSGDEQAIKQLKSSIDTVKNRLAVEMQHYAENIVTQIELERNIHVLETVYMDLSKHLSQIELFLDTCDLQAGNRQVIEPPVQADEPEWKTTMFSGVLGALSGLLLGLLFAGIRERGDHVIDSKHTVARYLRMSVIATVNELSAAEMKQLSDYRAKNEY